MNVYYFSSPSSFYAPCTNAFLSCNIVADSDNFLMKERIFLGLVSLIVVDTRLSPKALPITETKMLILIHVT